MNQPRTHASLLNRIVQADERAKIAPYLSPDTRREPSFVERYRGTEWETPRSPVIVSDKPPARGHAYVWVTLSAMLATTALIIAGASL